VRPQFIIINGPPGVGKSTTCRILAESLPPSVWLDGDWCWMMHPFRPLVTEENKKMVISHITFMLHNFLSNPSFHYVIFSWVIPQPDIFDLILNPLSNLVFDLHRYTLLCEPATLVARIAGDPERAPVTLQEAKEALAPFHLMDTCHLNTTHLDPATVAQRIALDCRRQPPVQ
jgi:hypothetical protein